MSFSIDIIIPVYNAPDHARRCIESVLAHDHADCRITLIDDGSPDPGVATLFAELEKRRLPQVALLRDRSGKWNFSTLGNAAPAKKGGAAPEAGGAPAKPTPQAGNKLPNRDVTAPKSGPHHKASVGMGQMENQAIGKGIPPKVA